MTFIPVPNTWQVAVEQTLPGLIPAVNKFYIVSGSFVPLTQAIADATADFVEDLYETSGIAGDLSTQWSLDHVVVTDLTTATSPQFHGSFDPLVGSNAGQIAQPSQAGLIEWQTALRGRSFRGRWFQRGWCQDATSGGVPAAGIITNLNTFGSGMVSGLHLVGPPTQDMAVVSRFSGMQNNNTGRGRLRRIPVPRATGLATPVTLALTESVWKLQRRSALAG